MVAVVALTLFSGLVSGLVLHGAASVGVSIVCSLLSFFAGYKAITKVIRFEQLFPR